MAESDTILLQVVELVETIVPQLVETVETIQPQVVEAQPGPPGTTTWEGITDKPETYAPADHGHAIADVSGLQTELDAKAEAQATADAFESVNQSLASKAPSSHGHAIADVSDLQTALDGKSATSHTHTPASIGAAAAIHGHAIADVSGLQTALDGKSATDHTHAYSTMTGLPPPLRISMTEPADASCLWIQIDASGNPVSLWLKSA